MSTYKKKLLLTTSLCLAVLMSGCSSAGLSDWMQNQAIKQSGVNVEQVLAEMEQAQEEQIRLAEQIKSEQEEAVKRGSVKLSLARNQYLLVDYYRDEARKEKLGLVDYINPGDSIFISEPVLNNPPAKAYYLQGFTAYQYDGDGSRTGRLELQFDENTREIIIPKDLNFPGLSIAPVGGYHKREFRLRAYTVTQNGRESLIDDSLTWKLNGQVFSNDTSVKLGVADSYVPVLSFNQEKYSFTESTPPPFHYDKSRGTVTFSEITPQDDSYDISVELHQNYNVFIAGDKVKQLIRASSTVDGTPSDFVKEGNQWVAKSQSPGARIQIEVKKGYFVICDEGILLSGPQQSGNQLIYAFDIPKGFTDYHDIHLDVLAEEEYGVYQEKPFPNGHIYLFDSSSGTQYVSGERVRLNAKVIMRLAPNAGYYIEGATNDDWFEKKMKYSEYIKKVDKYISQHPSRKYIEVTLASEDAYGKAAYSIDGSGITGKQLLKAGQTLVMDYEVTKEGYIIRSGEKSGSLQQILGFMRGQDSSGKSTRISIPVADDLDGAEIIPSDYIRVEAEK